MHHTSERHERPEMATPGMAGVTVVQVVPSKCSRYLPPTSAVQSEVLKQVTPLSPGYEVEGSGLGTKACCQVRSKVNRSAGEVALEPFAVSTVTSTVPLPLGAATSRSPWGSR
jgi:hypothetical protein